MGYSSTRAAADTLAYIHQLFQAPGLKTRVLRFGSADYFFERGREQPDGAITGTLLVCTTAGGYPTCADDENDHGYARRVGTVRIEADGTITRFPRLSSRAKTEINLLVAGRALPSLPCMVI